MSFPNDWVDSLLSRVSIIKVIKSFGIKLTKQGSHFTAKCPFHTERTPSFFVYQDSQKYYCFGCGAGGDVITFLIRYSGYSFLESIIFLSKRAKIRLPYFRGKNYRQIKKG